MNKIQGPEIDWDEVAEVYRKLSMAAKGHGLSTAMLAFGQLIVHQAIAADKLGTAVRYATEGGK